MKKKIKYKHILGNETLETEDDIKYKVDGEDIEYTEDQIIQMQRNNEIFEYQINPSKFRRI